jgi:hypothetical protein
MEKKRKGVTMITAKEQVIQTHVEESVESLYGKLLEIAREPVSSSNLASVGYDGVMKVISIEFKGGEVYCYLDCERELFDNLMKAESQGKFFYTHIRNVKEFVHVN